MPNRYFLTSTKTILISFMLVITAVVALVLLGRNPVCECGYIKLWHGVTQSSQNSQHIFDWYSFTHLLHGLGFFYLTLIVFKKYSTKFRFLTALLLESFWEVIENTRYIIERYRIVTISFDYYGDSIINSLGDILTMCVGFLIASLVPLVVVVMLFIVIELFLWFMIGDNLYLNIVKVLNPFK